MDKPIKLFHKGKEVPISDDKRLIIEKRYDEMSACFDNDGNIIPDQISKLLESKTPTLSEIDRDLFCKFPSKQELDEYAKRIVPVAVDYEQAMQPTSAHKLKEFIDKIKQYVDKQPPIDIFTTTAETHSAFDARVIEAIIKDGHIPRQSGLIEHSGMLLDTEDPRPSFSMRCLKDRRRDQKVDLFKNIHDYDPLEAQLNEKWNRNRLNGSMNSDTSVTIHDDLSPEITSELNKVIHDTWNDFMFPNIPFLVPYDERTRPLRQEEWYPSRSSRSGKSMAIMKEMARRWRMDFDDAWYYRKPKHTSGIKFILKGLLYDH